jgi:septal ring-binding cell division protein DamX
MSEERTGTGKGLLPSALLVAAVGAILLAGLALRTDGRTVPRPAPSEAAAPSALPLGSEVKREPEPEAPPPPLPTPEEVTAPPVIKEIAVDSPANPLLMTLAMRAQSDSARLSGARGRWTAQLLVACKAETVDRLLAAAPGTGKIYVLPARVKDEACFRVCFGDYASPKEAAAAADLPAALRGKEKIVAAEVAKVLP